MSGQIFICYRRDDTAYVTGHINDRLCEEFGAESVFTDVDNIALGVDFRTILDDMVGQCQIFLAVIGESWLTARNPDGALRLQDPSDFVRIEIESALQRNIPVIPLLVGGTKMPSKDDLPDSLKNLAFRNGTLIRPAPDFHGDIDRLVNSLKKHLQATPIEPKREDRGQAPTQAAPERAPTPQQLPAETKLAPEEDDREEPPGTVIKLEDEDKARKLVELHRDRVKKKRSAFAVRPFIVVGLLILAGASWYIDFEYQEQFNRAIAALEAMQAPARDDEIEIDTTIPAPAQSELDAGIRPTADALVEPRVEIDPVDEARLGVDALAEPQGELADETRPEGAALAETQPGPDALTEALVEAPAEAQAVTDGGAEGQADAGVLPQASGETDTIAEAEPEGADAVTEDRRTPVAEAQPERDASEIIREGVSLAALGDHRAAIENYDEAFRLGADSGFAYRQRGASYFELGDYEAAIVDFGEAIRLNAEDANAYYSRGTSHHAAGDYEAAIADYDEAIRLNAEDADAYDKRAAAHEALGNHEAAERDLAAAASIRSERADSQ